MKCICVVKTLTSSQPVLGKDLLNLNKLFCKLEYKRFLLLRTRGQREISYNYWNGHAQRYETFNKLHRQGLEVKIRDEIHLGNELIE